MKELIKKAKILIEEMLPYIQKFRGKIVVIKYGGNAMINEELKNSVLKDIALLKTLGIKPVIVHGGGPEITKEMNLAGIKPKFIEGLRVTDEKTIGIIAKVFQKTNNEIIETLSNSNIKAKELKNSLFAEEKDKNLGLVGNITKVDSKKITQCLNNDLVPVISPIGTSEKNKEIKYNINADTAATEIAIGLKAEKLTILTNIDGVLDNGKLISHLKKEDAIKKINNKIITEGMIPKVKACIKAVEAGCKKAHLINGTIEHSLLMEIFTQEGIGTEVVKNEC